MNYVSGYDPDTNICWNFRNKGDRAWEWTHRKTCPVCTKKHGERDLICLGRCRSGRRWFWRTVNFTRSCREPDLESETAEQGFVDSEEQAWTDMLAAAVRLAEGRPASVVVTQDTASHGLKKLNKAKRAARPPPDTEDARLVEYLYGRWGGKHRILKRTKTRVYYNQIEENNWEASHEPRVGFIERAQLELPDDVEHWHDHKGRERHRYLFLRPPPPPEWHPEAPDLRELKAAMAAAHPDRGGSNGAFIEARKRYLAARQRSGAAP
jgi:hypothetical protein